MDEKKGFILTQIKTLNVYQREGERAPHKPLLLLLALARVAQHCERLALFTEIEEPLNRLLKDYGPPRKSVHPEYPFWWLQSDKLWEVPNSDSLVRRAGSTSPLKSEFIKKKVSGGLPEYVYQAFRKDRRFLERAVSVLLENNFPESLHQDILDEVGLSVSTRHRRRDPQFRADVIRAYEHRCAICGYDLKISASDLALEAAHIKWHQSGGPDCVQNGLALCAIHHKSLDRGAIGISREFTVLISSELHGIGGIVEWFLAFKDQRIRRPTRSEWTPNNEYIEWHMKQVFKKPARD